MSTSALGNSSSCKRSSAVYSHTRRNRTFGSAAAASGAFETTLSKPPERVLTL